MWKCEIHGRIAFCISVPYVKYIPAQSQSPFGLDISYFRTQNICFVKASTRHAGTLKIEKICFSPKVSIQSVLAKV